MVQAALALQLENDENANSYNSSASPTSQYHHTLSPFHPHASSLVAPQALLTDSKQSPLDDRRDTTKSPSTMATATATDLDHNNNDDDVTMTAPSPLSPRALLLSTPARHPTAAGTNHADSAQDDTDMDMASEARDQVTPSLIAPSLLSSASPTSLTPASPSTALDGHAPTSARRGQHRHQRVASDTTALFYQFKADPPVTRPTGNNTRHRIHYNDR
jgi:hypothetical protein